MKVSRMSLLVIFLVSSIVGCNNSLYGILSRCQKDPDNFTMQVRSFKKASEIQCFWESDERSDEYILMRSCDSEKRDFKTVYSGHGLSYVDKDLEKEQRYIYRLDKMRGAKRFIGRKTYLGVCSTMSEDIYEDNDSPDRATILEQRKPGNLYHYKGIYGEECKDVDWYCVRVPARRSALIRLEYRGVLGSVLTPFKVQLPYNDESVSIANNVDIAIKNEKDEEVFLSFKIFGNESEFVGGGAGGKIESYIVSLIRIE